MALLDWIKKAKRTMDQRETSSSSSSSSEGQPFAGATSASVEERYDNRGEVARGGMGAILKVVDRQLLRTSAMKVLEPLDGKKDDTRRAIFREEAQITSQLDHPNICPVYDGGTDDAGTEFITMKLVKGQTLSDVIHAAHYDPADLRCLREALEVFLKVCDALAFAHAKGVLHRDLKPENIMVGAFGQVYLMDWGVAKVMPKSEDADPTADHVRVSRTGMSATDQPGAIVGTLMYMAPEQAQGSTQVDIRSDVFGLGAILYEILTQIPPYYAQNIGDLVLQAQHGSWRPPQEVCGDDLPLPAALCAVCEKALHPKPEARFQDVMQLKAAVEEFLVGGLTFPTQNFALGESIITEGEYGESAFIIQRGYCRVYKYVAGEMRALADLGPGDVFGETAVFADAPRMATVQAISEVTVQVVTKEVFTKDLGVASSMGAFVKALATRFVNVDKELRAVQDELRAVKAQLVALAADASAPVPAPSTPSEPPPIAMAPLELPPPPPRADGTVPSVPSVPSSPESSSPESSSPMESSSRPAELTLSTLPTSTSSTAPPGALVLAMALLYKQTSTPEAAAAMLVEAATVAAQALYAPVSPPVATDAEEGDGSA